MIWDAKKLEFELEAAEVERELMDDEGAKKVVEDDKAKRIEKGLFRFLKREQELEKQNFVNLSKLQRKITANEEEVILSIKNKKEPIFMLSKGKGERELERHEHDRLKSELKEKINKCRLVEEKLLKDADDLKWEKENLEREWEELNVKRAELEKDVKSFNEQKENFEKEKQEKLDFMERELEAAKQSFEAVGQERAMRQKRAPPAVSWFRKCTSKIFNFSASKKTEPSAAVQSFEDSDLKPEICDNASLADKGTPGNASLADKGTAGNASLADKGTSGNARKRKRDDDYGEGHSDSVTSGKRTKMSLEESVAQPKLGVTVENAKASSKMSAGNEDENGGTRAVDNEDQLRGEAESSMVGDDEGESEHSGELTMGEKLWDLITT